MARRKRKLTSWWCDTCEEDVADHPGRTVNLKFDMCSACVENIRGHIHKICIDPGHKKYWEHHVTKKVNRGEVIKTEYKHSQWQPAKRRKIA